jgi:hypothetical protein
MMARLPVYIALKLNCRNRQKLQKYQREYARRKRAPGLRKVSKAERRLLEEQYAKKELLMEREGPRTAYSQCVISSPGHVVLSRHQGSTNARLLYARELLTLYVLPRWPRGKNTLGGTSKI